MTPVLMEFLTSDGAPLGFARVEIRLTRSDFEEEASGVLMPRLIEVTTGMDGKVLQELMPCNTRYHVTVYDTVSDVALHHDFYVPVLNSLGFVRLQDLIVADDAFLSELAYDEATLLTMLSAKAITLAARDEAVAAIGSIQEDADTAEAAAAIALNSKFAAANSADQAYTYKNMAEGSAQDAANALLLADDRAAVALQAKIDALAAAAASLASAAASSLSATAAADSAYEADFSEAGANAARDAAAVSATNSAAARDAGIAARDVSTTARDVTLAARDVATSARDVAVANAAQLASQLFSFNEIYLGKYAVAPLVDGNGGVLKVGAIYENTVEGKIYQWESDLAWHAYDEESQLQLNNATLAASNAAASAGAALTSANNSAASATAAANSATAAAGSVTAAAGSAAAALASQNTAAQSVVDANAAKVIAVGAKDTATTKASEAAQSAADAAVSAAQALAGQLPANWTETDVNAKTFIQNKPVLAPVATSGAKADVGLGNVDNTSDVNKPVSTAQAAANNLRQLLSEKDTANGYAGLSGFKIALKNAAGTVISYLTSVATVARTWTFPDKDGTVAMISDITGTNSGVNTGDETGASIRTKLGATVVTGSNTGDETNSTILTKLGIPSISGTNTGDETGAGIRTKLGIATLSGSNTGDQTLASLGIPNVNNTSDMAKPVSTAMQTALDLKANITYVDSKVAALVAASPAALDTLAELATALGNDGNFATTMTNSLASKLPLAGGNLSGTLGTRAPGNVSTVTALNGANTPLYINQSVVPSNGTPSFSEFLHNTTVLSGQGYVQHISIGAYRPGTIGWGGAVYMAIGGSDNNATEAFFFNYGGTISHSSAPVNITGNATYSLNSTRLYATGGNGGVGAGYGYQETSPYYMTMKYQTGSNRWRLEATPATPVAIEVAWADGAAAVAGLTIGSGTNATVSGGNNMAQNTIGYVTGVVVLGQTDGALYGQGYDSATYQHQIFGDYRSGQIAVRGRGMGNGVWTAWRTVWDTSNLIPATAATAGTVALRDGGGSIYATTFQGSGSGLTGTAASLTAGKANLLQFVNGVGGGTTFNWTGQGGQPTWLWGGTDSAQMYVYNPSNFSVANSANLNGVPASQTMQKRRGEVGNAGPSMAAVSGGPAEYGFCYPSDGSVSGPFMQFGGLGPSATGNYNAQFNLDYATGNTFRFRVKNDDTNTMNPWRDVWHTGNLPTPAVSSAVTSLVQRTTNGYIYGNYILMTDDGNPGENGAAVTAIITKRGDDYYRSTNATRVKTFLGITGADVYAVRSNIDSYVGVCREMAWKNYGNSHTIFDASQGLSPSGSAVNNTNSANVWSATYPTLMGWNGSTTYGVRVDSARTADLLAGLAPTAGNTANTVVVRDGTGYCDLGGGTHGRVISHGVARGSYGSISVTGVTNTYCGIDFTAAFATLMSDGTTSGWYYNNAAWSIQWSNGGNFIAAGNITAYSDERLKKNWRSLEADFVSRWASIKSGIYDRIDSGETQVGASAQDVQKILPNAVQIAKNDALEDCLSLNYGAASLVATVELAKRSEDQAADIRYLKRQVAAQNETIEQLMRVIHDLRVAVYK